MSTVLERRPTAADTTEYILLAIDKLARDKNGRVMKDDHIEWLETKLREIARLARILRRRSPSAKKSASARRVSPPGGAR